jgi:hypothetical protein
LPRLRRRGKPGLYRRKNFANLEFLPKAARESQLHDEPNVTKVIYRAKLAAHFGGVDQPASYGFWYSDDLETAESASANLSANSYNEKSLKPHLKQ